MVWPEYLTLALEVDFLKMTWSIRIFSLTHYDATAKYLTLALDVGF